MALHSDLAKVMIEDSVELSTDGNIILVEEDPNARMKVEVTKPSTDVLMVDVRKLGPPTGIKQVSGYHVRCDYMLIFELNGSNHAILIELKKTLGYNICEAKEQLRRSLPLLDYLRSFCEVHYQSRYSKSGLSIRYFIIGEQYTPRLDKQSVNSNPAKRLTREYYRGITIHTYVGPRLHFSMLVNG